MAWPKGVPRKKKEEGAVVSDRKLEEVIQTVGVATRKKINLTNAKFDPFTKFKTDEKRFYYRALNTKPENLSIREAEGFQLIPEAKFGDLVLAKMPRDMHEEATAETREKTERQTEAAVTQFKETAASHGVETFEENP